MAVTVTRRPPADDITREIAQLKRRLIANPKSLAEASPEAICAAIEQNVLPLLQAFEKHAAELKELFSTWGRTVCCRLLGHDEVVLLCATEHNWPMFVMDRLRVMKRANQPVAQLYYQYSLAGLKTAARVKQVWIGVDVYFTECNYRIQVKKTGNEEVYNYKRVISASGRQELVRPMVKNFIEQIKCAV